MKKVLNVGGSNKKIALPPQYQGWENVVLDIDPTRKPDVVCDARNLSQLPRAQYDAVYCSHNLEHYYRHEVPRVLAGFLHVLKTGGFAHIVVPDMGEVMRNAVQRQIDIDDVLYESPAGPITVLDVIYGYGVEIEQSGSDFYAHKTGFTHKSLCTTLVRNGFPHVFAGTGNLEVIAFAFRDQPDAAALSLIGLSS